MAVKVPFVPAEMIQSQGFDWQSERPTNQDFMMALSVMKDQGRLKPDAPQPLFLQQQAAPSPTKEAFTPDGSS